jgi:hypothetical protein
MPETDEELLEHCSNKNLAYFEDDSLLGWEPG